MRTTKVLITGGAGTIGLALVQQLLARPEAYQVSVLEQPSRQARRRLAPFEARLSLFWGDICDASIVAQACRSQDAVIHLAAIIPPLADSQPELAQRVNVEGTRTLVNVLEAMSQPLFLLYSSSVAVYGDRLEQPFIRASDTLCPSPADDYGRGKVEAECIIQASGLDWTIFRLAAIFGIGNHSMSGLMFQMPLATPIEFATPSDTARAFAKALGQRGRLAQQVFNLGGGESCRLLYKDFLSKNFSLFGLGKPDFPDHCFAEHNFHCGYYDDGEALEAILSFRQDSVESYFEQLKATIPRPQKTLTRLLRPLVKGLLRRQSEPLAAVKSKDSAQLERFFKPETVAIIRQQ